MAAEKLDGFDAEFMRAVRMIARGADELLDSRDVDFDSDARMAGRIQAVQISFEIYRRMRSERESQTAIELQRGAQTLMKEMLERGQTPNVVPIIKAEMTSHPDPSEGPDDAE